MPKDRLLEEFLAEQDVSEESDDSPFILLKNELKEIRNEDMRQFIKAVLMQAKFFWFAPVAPDDRDELQNLWTKDSYKPGGDLLNTQRVVRAADVLSSSHQLDDDDHDILLTAAFIHGITKYAPDEDDIDSPKYDVMHPYTVDKLMAEMREKEQVNAIDGIPHTINIVDDIVIQVLRLVRCQRGPWSIIPETLPVTLLEILLHTACQMVMNLDYIVDGHDIVEERWEF